METDAALLRTPSDVEQPVGAKPSAKAALRALPRGEQEIAESFGDPEPTAPVVRAPPPGAALRLQPLTAGAEEITRDINNSSPLPGTETKFLAGLAAKRGSPSTPVGRFGAAEGTAARGAWLGPPAARER